MSTVLAAPHRLTTQVALAGSAVLLLGAMSAVPAWAHDSLISSTPEAGAVLDESPEEIVLEFSGEGLTTGESIPNTMWVTDSDGEHWEGETEVDGPTMWTELEEPLPNGEYEVLYHAVYSDGHSEELSFDFEVDAPVVDDEEDGTEEEAAAEDAATEPSADDDAAAAEETEPADEATEETGPEQTEGAAAETQDQFPVWTAIAFGVGALLLVVLGAIFVRRKLKQDD